MAKVGVVMFNNTTIVGGQRKPTSREQLEAFLDGGISRAGTGHRPAEAGLDDSVLPDFY